MLRELLAQIANLEGIEWVTLWATDVEDAGDGIYKYKRRFEVADYKLFRSVWRVTQTGPLSTRCRVNYAVVRTVLRGCDVVTSNEPSGYTHPKK